MPRIDLLLPKPHAGQLKIMRSKAKRKVICTGRRFGKTLMGGLITVDDGFGHGLLYGHKILLASTSQDQSDIFWRYIVKWLRPLIDQKLIYKNETKRLLTFGDKGMVKVKTGSDENVLRGFDADTLVLDECSRLDPRAWHEVAAPIMADRGGTAYFLSTPNRKNWFFHLYQKAIQDTTGAWAAFHATTLENPHLNQAAIQALSQDMTNDSYRQEILAEFLDSDGSVFHNIEVCAAPDRPVPYAGKFVIGVDTAQTVDSSVFIVMDREKHQMVDMDRFNGTSWSVYRGRLIALCEKWKPEHIIFEINAAGSPNFEALYNEGLPIIPFTTTAQSKPPLVESLILAFEREELKIFDDPVLMGELSAFERRVSSTGRSQYSAPEGLHDDTVMALALCWYGVVNLAPTWQARIF